MGEILLNLHGAAFIGILCFVIGFLIRIFRWTFLIAGFEDSAEIPEGVAATLVGGFMLRIGLATIIYGVVLTELQPDDWISPVFSLLVLGATGQLIYRLNTYEQPEQPGSSVD